MALTDYHEQLAEQLARALESANRTGDTSEPAGCERDDLSPLLHLAVIIARDMHPPVPYDPRFKQTLRSSLLRNYGEPLGGHHLCGTSLYSDSHGY